MATMSRKARRWLVAALGLTALFGLLALATGYLYVVVPKMEARWADFGVDLSTPAKLMIKTSHAVIEWGWLLALAGIASVLGLVVVWFVVALRVLMDVPDERAR